MFRDDRRPCLRSRSIDNTRSTKRSRCRLLTRSLTSVTCTEVLTPRLQSMDHLVSTMDLSRTAGWTWISLSIECTTRFSPDPPLTVTLRFPFTTNSSLSITKDTRSCLPLLHPFLPLRWRPRPLGSHLKLNTVAKVETTAALRVPFSRLLLRPPAPRALRTLPLLTRVISTTSLNWLLSTNPGSCPFWLDPG